MDIHPCTGVPERITKTSIDCFLNTQGEDGYKPLHSCARKINKNILRLLLEHNADLNIQDNHGYTPLHRFALTGNETICRLSIERNADVNIQDKSGYTPLH